MPRRLVKPKSTPEKPEFKLGISCDAETELAELFQYIEQQSGRLRADAYFDQLMRFLDRICYMPKIGTNRDDLVPGLRVTNFQGSLIIAYHIDGKQVVIDRCFYGGRNWSRLLQFSTNNPDS